MTYISAVETAVPPYKCELSDLRAAVAEWLSANPSAYALFDRFLSNSKTSRRFYCMPPKDILKLRGSKERADFFEEHAPALLIDVGKRALQSGERNSRELGALVFTSCTCPTIPALDVRAIDGLQLRRDITRVPIYQYGCAGGVAGLSLAAELSRARGSCMLLSVELCSLVFQSTKQEASDLVGASLFADGAGAVLLSEEHGALRILDRYSYLLPDSFHLMGYNQTDLGPHLRLDRELPMILSEYAPQQVSLFLQRNGLQGSDIDSWLFHPGGIKILEALCTQLKIAKDSCDFAYRVLENYGNMSSATVIFVLKEFLNSQRAKAGQHVVLMGIGPGLSLELVLFEMAGLPREK